MAGQGFLFSSSRSLDDVARTPFMERRVQLRAERAAYAELTATGRFRAADLWPLSAAG